MPPGKVTGRSNRVLVWALLGALMLGLVLAQSWATYQLFTSKYPGGNDFAARWFNGCALIWSGESPYSDEVTTQTQIEMYGRPALPGEDLVAFSYPIYAIYFFWPLCYLQPYTLVQAVWMTLILYGVIAGTFLAIRTCRLRLDKGLLVVTLIWAVLAYPQARAVLLGQMVILVFIAVGLSLLAFQRKGDFWAGVWLAAATIKPQVVVFLVLWLLWTSAWQKRWRFWWGFCGTLATMAGIGLLLVPSWPIDFYHQVMNYANVTVSPYYSLTWMIVQEIFGLDQVIEIVLTLLLGLYMAFEWWRNRAASDDALLWTTGLTLNLTFFIVVQIATTSYVMLLFPIFQLFRLANHRASRIATPLILGIELFLFLGQWLIFVTTVEGNFETLPAYLLLPVGLLITQILTRKILVQKSSA